MLGIGFYIGVVSSHFFYPGEQVPENSTIYEAPSPGPITDDSMDVPENRLDYGVAGMVRENGDFSVSGQDTSVEAAAASETLSADTEYVLEETNILDQSVVETYCFSS